MNIPVQPLAFCHRAPHLEAHRRGWPNPREKPQMTVNMLESNDNSTAESYTGVIINVK